MIAAWVPEKERGKLGSVIFGGGQVCARQTENLNQKTIILNFIRNLFIRLEVFYHFISLV